MLSVQTVKEEAARMMRRRAEDKARMEYEKQLQQEQEAQEQATVSRMYIKQSV